MSASQDSISYFRPMFFKATAGRRIVAGVVFVVILGIFTFVWSLAHRWISIPRTLGVCGFKQTYSLPCPTCYMTTSAIAFVNGRIWDSFYIQPAGGVFCCGLVAVAVFALLISLFGVDFGFLHRPMSSRVIKYVVISIIIVLTAGWAVTFCRAIA